MVCKSCETQIPKRAKKCPKCGMPVVKEEKNLKILAIVGAVIAFIGGLFPLVQVSSLVEIAFGFMNGGDIMKDVAAYAPEGATWADVVMGFPEVAKSTFGGMFWYIFMLALIATILLVIFRYEKISIVTTLIAVGTLIAYFFVIQDAHLDPSAIETLYETKTAMKPLLTDYGMSEAAIEEMGRSKRLNFCVELAQMSVADLREKGLAEIGMGLYITLIGAVISIAGVFIDVFKFIKKKTVKSEYLRNNRTVAQRMYTYRWFYLMFLPVLLFVLAFNYWPMLGIRFAFTKYSMVGEPIYVGIYQFLKMFKEADFWEAFRNTLQLSVLSLLVNTFGAVIISLMLHEIVSLLFKKTVQTIVYLPHFMSWVVAASVFRLFLGVNGTMNDVLMTLNITREPIKFLLSNETWRPVYYFINGWKSIGWGTILFLATLSGISPDLYEAAQIDGANRWQRMKFITLPSLANTIITVLILNLAKVMNIFESVFVLTNDAVVDTSQVVQTYVYKMTFGIGVPDYGYTTAVGLFRSLASAVLVLVCNYASKKVRGRGIV